MRKMAILASLCLLVAALLPGRPADAGENWLGTWKLNPEKSKLGTGAARAQTLKFESTPAGIKLTSEGTDAEVAR